MDYNEYQVLQKFRERLVSEIGNRFRDIHNSEDVYPLERLKGMQSTVVLLDRFIKESGE